MKAGQICRMAYVRSLLPAGHHRPSLPHAANDRLVTVYRGCSMTADGRMAPVDPMPTAVTVRFMAVRRTDGSEGWGGAAAS